MTCPCNPETYCAGRANADLFRKNDRKEQLLADPAALEALDTPLRMDVAIYSALRNDAADHHRI